MIRKINKILKNNDIIRDLIYYIPSKVIPAFIGFFSVMIYTRLLTPNEYGIYNLIITTVSILTSVFLGWITQSSLRFYKQYELDDEEDIFLTTVILLLFIISGLIILFFFLLNRFTENLISGDFIYYLKIGILLVPVGGFFSVVTTIRRAKRDSLFYSSYIGLRSLLKFLISVYLLYNTNLSIYALIIGVLIADIIILLIEFYFYKLKWNLKFIKTLHENYRYIKTITKKIWKYGLPLIGVSITGLILNVVDRYMIQYYMDSDSVGLYSAGYKVAEMSIKNIFMILMLVAFPIIINSYEKFGAKVAAKKIAKFLSYYNLILIPAVVGISVLSEDITFLVLGDGFISSYHTLPWIALGVFAQGLTMYINKPYELRGNTKYIFFLLLISSIINIILNILMIPRFGINGAAYATFLSYVLYLVISLIKIKGVFPLHIEKRTVFKSVISASVMGLLLFIANESSIFRTNIFFLLLKIFLGMIFYFFMLLILNENYVKDIYKKIINNITRGV